MRNIKNKKLQDFCNLLNKSVKLDYYFKYTLKLDKGKWIHLFIAGDNGGAIRIKEDISEFTGNINELIKKTVDLGIEYMMSYIIWSERTERIPGESQIIYSWPESLDEIKRIRSQP
jgi:plasmid replication initiation protein